MFARRVPCVLGILASLLGCEAEGPFIGRVSHSRFFEYHDREHVDLCPTLLSLLDQHAERIGRKIGLALDASEPLRYYRFQYQPDYSFYADGCEPNSSGCVVDGSVYSTTYFHAHELVHQYVSRAWGSVATGLLLEGEAVALSCNPLYAVRADQRPRDAFRASLGSVDWRDLLYLGGDTKDGYGAAGFFVTYLADRYGWSKVAELHRRVPPGISVVDFERQFATVYPIPMDEAWARALDATGGPACQPTWQCITTPLSVGDEAVLDCDGEPHRSVDIAGERGAVLTLRADADEPDNTEETALLACKGAVEQYVIDRGRSKRTTHWASLPAGSYAIVPSSTETKQRLELTSYFGQQLADESCDSAPTIPLDPQGDTYVDLLAGRVGSIGASNAYLRVSGGGQSYSIVLYDLVPDDPLAEDAFALCDDCGSTSTCKPLDAQEATSVVVGERAVLRMQDVQALPPATRPWGQVVFLPEPTGDSDP